ncbi:hypothetical protein ACIPPM_22155 [Streptomyces sp. NPDC090119]|uniref:hypothetical protein n=1 Tax=Streptomyces sp. NPDC090119 TaxID=3365951 RepID=UPI0038276DB5
MTFTLDGRDQLSRVLDGAGDAAERLRRRLARTSDESRLRLAGFTQDADGRLRNLRGQFVATGSVADALRTQVHDLTERSRADFDKFGEHSVGSLKMLALAALPVAASLLPIVASAGTVGVAVGAMGAAIAGQIKSLGEASEAEKAWDDAVAKSGAHSKEAVAAQAEYARAVAVLPPKTREAAAAVGVLKDNYQAWSDSLSGDTMGGFIKGVAIVDALLPKTTGLVKVAGRETDRFMTIVGGEMASPGLDKLNARFTAFADRTLRGLNDELVHLLRVSDGAQIGGGVAEFMDWARAQGPTVVSVLRSISEAVVNVLHGAGDMGVGMLQVVDVLAKVVSAVPPEAIGTMLQMALALRLVKSASLGLAAGRSVVAAFAAQMLLMRTEAAAAPGALAGARAAIMSLSRTAKVAVAGTGIGLLLIALSELSSRSEQAPPDVDKLTSSLKQLGSTGKATGEASRAFGKDLGGLYDKVRSLTDPTTTDQVQQWIVTLGGLGTWDSTPVKNAKGNIDAIDGALANLVQSGHQELAAAAVQRLGAAYAKGGHDTSEFTGKLTGYKQAIADVKFEQQLAADSMGVFGQQAQSVQQKLNAQKLSADGLRQSLQALNDVQRQGLGGMIGFEASIDAAAKAARDNAGSLRMVHGELDLNSEKARNAATALNDLASKTDEAASQARESGASWETVNGIYDRGRSKLIAAAQAMGLSSTEANRLAGQILKIPDKAAKVSMSTEDARRDLDGFISKVKGSPGAKSVTLTTLSAGAQRVLEAFGYKVTHLKDGRVQVSASTGTALSNLYAVQRARNALTDKAITITTNRVTKFTSVQGGVTVAKRDYAQGGRIRALAGGGPAGDVQYFPDGGPISGPGTGTSDSIWAMFASGARARVSNTEYVIRAASVARYGVPFLDAVNSGTFDLKALSKSGLAGGGLTGAGGDAARGLAVGLTGSTGVVDAAARVMAGAVVTGIRAELEIASPSKKTKALMADVGKGMIIGLTGSQAKIKATAADLAKDIWTAFSGKKDDRYVAYVNTETNKLLAAAKKRDVLKAKIAQAKAFASDLTKNAREGAALSNLGLEPGQVTAASIKGGLAAKLAQIKQVTKYIGILAKRGLNKSLLHQILNMGPEQGYAYASALVGADKATFSSINSLETQINKSTTTLGQVGADRMYDSGKNASKGFLKGLESEEKALEKTMVKIATAMQKALRKALGIKSPARATMPDGVNVVRGIAVGAVQGLPYIDRAMQAVGARMTGHPALAVTPGRAAVVGSGGQHISVQIDISGALDPYATAREVEKVLAKVRRGRGGASYAFG